MLIPVLAPVSRKPGARSRAGRVAVALALAWTAVPGHAADAADDAAAATAPASAGQAAAPLALAPAPARRLPPVGTAWCYSSGARAGASMTLSAVEGDVATYRLDEAPGQPSIRERIGAYSIVDATRHGERRILAFPLAQGKQWRDKYDQTVTAGGARLPYRYRLHVESTSTVTGAERVTTAAGTFDTFVVERNIDWTRSEPKALDDALKDARCASPACSVSGVAREVTWYAPSVGRAVLRAYLRGADFMWIGSGGAADTLHNAASFVTELVAYGPGASCQAAPAPLMGRLPSAPAPGFAPLMNDSWEFLMRRDGIGD
ncbi:MAG: hypothetical protein V4764_19215 [Burkholderia sp.]